MMPIGGRRYDFQYGDKGFMLARGSYKGRAWSRTGRADTPSQRSAVDARFGVLPDALDHPEVWDDWTGGFGHAYRQTGEPTYHWGENFDGRFAKQLIHCQAPREITAATGTYILPDIQQMGVIPPTSTATIWGDQYRVAKVILKGGWGIDVLSPLSTGTFDEIAPAGTGGAKSLYNVGRMVTTQTGLFSPHLTSSGSPRVQQFNLPSLVLGANIDLPYLSMVDGGDRTWIAVGGSGNLRAAVRSIVGDPVVTANLTATLLVGDDLAVINDMTVLEDQLFVGKSNGLYAGDRSGSFINLTPWLRQSGNNDNFRDLMPWAGGVLGQTVQALWYYRSNGYTAELQEVPILKGRSPVQGYVRALGNCGPWVYAGHWTGSGSYLLATRDIPSTNPRWHTLQHFPGHAVTRILFDGITTASGIATVHIPQRAYVAMTADLAGTYPPYYWAIPGHDDNPLAAQSVFSPNYIGSARIDLGNVDWGAPGTPKVYRAVEVWADTLLSGYRYADVYYAVDQSSSFTLLGRAQTSPKTTLYFSSGEGSFVTGQSIELSLRSFTASPAFSPVYRSLVLRGALQPRSVDMITTVVRIADGIRDRQGAEMRGGAVMLQELRDFASPDVNGVQAHQLIDLAGATQWAKIIGPVEEQEVYNQGEEYPEVAATVKFAVLTFS